MRKIVRTLLLGFALAAIPSLAFAQGEIFKMETSGIEYCGDFDNAKFNAKNNVDLWVRIVDDTQWDVSFAPDFPDDLTFPVFGVTYFATQKKLAFSGSQFFDDGAYIAMAGTAALERSGVIKSASGTFIQDSLVFAGCFSSGKWKTTLRLAP